MQFLRSLLKGVGVEALAVAEVTVDGQSTGIDVGAYDGTGLFILHSAAGSGTNPTLDVKLQESDAVGGTYADISGAAFTQIDDTAGGSLQVLAVDLSAAKQFIRLDLDVGGTTPGFYCGCTFLGFNKGS